MVVIFIFRGGVGIAKRNFIDKFKKAIDIIDFIAVPVDPIHFIELWNERRKIQVNSEQYENQNLSHGIPNALQGIKTR
ncbi:hypothetical protein SAMN04488109_4977 [Chryseolinea serpens]|uniref:Uncharacterized protein n=1 Tax=Chryseolinea serpens TaxID=947013 RepID=A0A1M5VBB8_9BACT|nr:hypothetical protein SAMN04488109_4977 [Chryseolinea serpens]